VIGDGRLAALCCAAPAGREEKNSRLQITEMGDEMIKWMMSWMRVRELDRQIVDLQARAGFAQSELNALRQTLEARMRKIAEQAPLSKERILNGLAKGADDAAVQSVLAIVKGMRVAAMRTLENAQAPETAATMARGKLAMASELEQAIGDCWAALEKAEKNSK
jgi:histone acetyltransferase (RNA polymerase elongator complex component)